MIITTLALVAATVTIHVIGLSALLRYFLPGLGQPPLRFWHTVRQLIGIAWALVLVHAIEIAGWAIFYRAAGCLPDAESALYFSGVTYATIGYGDLLLPAQWRILAPVEGLVGILMCGLSAALFFAFVSRLYLAKHKTELDRKGK